MRTMKRTTVTTLVANLRRATAWCLERSSGKATRTDSRPRGTSRIDDATTTGVLFPAVTGGWYLGLLLIGSLFAVTSLPAAEQDNWYLANEWSVPDANGIAYKVKASSGKALIYVSNINNRLDIFETNGTLNQTISGPYRVRDVAVDDNGTIFLAEERRVSSYDQNGNLLWRLGKDANSGSGSGGSGNAEFSYVFGIAVSPEGEVFVADRNNNRVQVLDRNGTFKRKFGSNGSAPGQFNQPQDIAFLLDGTLIVGDNSYLHYFQQDGTFIKRVNANNARSNVSVAPDDTLFSYQRLRDVDGAQIAYLSSITSNARTAFTPEFDLIASYGGKIQIWKRAYRTKGLATRNVIPQPAIRGIGQRAGTNIIDLDFEIVDPDDNNATVGILAAVDGDFDDTSKWILPTAWVDGTGSKIGVPLATNQVHRVSWNVKGDWNSSTGTLQFEVLCRDARRVDVPVDLHFLELPLADGNLTISRSPLTDSDFETHFKYLLATGEPGITLEDGSIVQAGEAPPQGSTQYVFTNAGKESREGPTWAEVNASYVGTNLEGQISMATQGIQQWTVPATGTYVIEAVGARGGNGASYTGGNGAYAKGVFNLVQGQDLRILVGQYGTTGTYSGSLRGGGGGGGTFVTETNNTAILVSGGGGGGGVHGSGLDGNTMGNGLSGGSGGGVGGVNGGGGGSYGSSQAGSGLTGNGNGKSFTNGGLGGDGHGDGGFGGGGSTAYGDGGGGGGGYSGGGGGGNNNPSLGGGGGGSFNADGNGTILSSFNYGPGKVIITYLPNGGNMNATISRCLLNAKGKISEYGKTILMNSLGHRFATVEEVNKAREAATPGSVNQWTPNRPIQPRNLPGKVNEFGFDTEREPSATGRYWWVVEQQQ
jgi:hypothetical protein